MPRRRHRMAPVRRPLPRLLRPLGRPVLVAVVGAVLLGVALAGAALLVSFRPEAAPGQAPQAALVVNDAAAQNDAAQREERTSRDRIRSSQPSTPVAQRPAATARPTPKPKPVPSGVPNGPCAISPEIEPHLTPHARAVYRAVCATFGSTVSSFGGYRPGDSGDHGSGRAVDIMVSGAPGWDIARYVQAHARELGVSYVIYQQHIWLVGDPTSQWKLMEDRGSVTANHFDHVHVSVA